MADLIDRERAEEIVTNHRSDFSTEKDYKTALACVGAVPSAQTEIIRCTECKHYREYDSKYVENAVVVQCMADRYPISEIIPDGWFCAGAERKDDE